MTYLYFPGCKPAYFLPQYDRATRAVLDALGIALHAPELTCCGYPVRHQSVEASVFAAARILALAAREALEVLTPCKCCYGNLCHARYWLKESRPLRRKVDALLGAEGLVFDADIRVRHLLTVVKNDVGSDRLQSRLARPLHGQRVAAHYGCHALRPAQVVQLDNPLAPTLFESVIEATGAAAVDWPLRLECCGAPLWEKNDALALKLMQRKLVDAARSGADLLCTACTYCQLQFDAVRAQTDPDRTSFPSLPAVALPQLLGLALGLSRAELGLDENRIVWAPAPRGQPRPDPQ